MIIQNKKTGKRVSLPKDQYETLKAVGYAKNWNIISSDDEPDYEPKVLPKEIIDFTTIVQKPKKKKKNA